MRRRPRVAVGVMARAVKWWRPLAFGLAAAFFCAGCPAAGAGRGACREASALRRLPRRGRQLQDGENSLARRPAGVLHPQSAFSDARGRAQGRGDGADRQGPEGRRSRRAVEAFRRACRPSAATSRSIRRWSSAAPRSPRQRRCGSCHLPSLAGQEQMPRLAKQRIDYLIDVAEESYRDNPRPGADTAMSAPIRRRDRRRPRGARALRGVVWLNPRTRRSASRCSRAAARSAAYWGRRTPSAR